MDYKNIINDMIDKIIDNDNVGAQVDFENAIQHKMNDAIEAKKQEVAASIYGSSVENSDEESVEEIDHEEEITDDNV